MMKPSWRALLILGRVSNLPTVWSNCLAGWILGGGGGGFRLLVLMAGASLIYTGGMFLNDAFDVDFDEQHRPERPIPSGAIALSEVWWWGAMFLGGGTLLLALLGWTTAILAILLTMLVLLYDAVHKALNTSPVLMAGCRFLLYLAASSAAVMGVTGDAIWSGLALALYVLGLSFLARRESLPGPLQYGAFLPLAAPALLAMLVNDGRHALKGATLVIALATWIVRALLSTRGGAFRNVGRTVAGLLAGVVLVDLLAVCGASPGVLFVFVALFLLTLALQRFVPAT
jgi:4-hydroxybenzoate polyprenyltransferase